MKAAIEISAATLDESSRVLTKEALEFVAELAQRFEPVRQELLARRKQRDTQIAAGAAYDFLTETAGVRAGDWQVAPAPADLDRRHVEITGPAERKMIINALNCGADVFMVYGGRLYLFGSERSRKNWAMDAARNVKVGDRYWDEETKDVPFRLQNARRYAFKVPGYQTDAELDAERERRRAAGTLAPEAM